MHWVSRRKEWEESEGSRKGETNKLRELKYNNSAWEFWGGFLSKVQELEDIWDKAIVFK